MQDSSGEKATGAGMLGAIALSVNAVKNEAALLLTRQLGVQQKTAWVLLMKLREAISAERLTGVPGD